MQMAESRRQRGLLPSARARLTSQCPKRLPVSRAEEEDKRSALDRGIREIDIVEPEFEQGAESAALTVIGATVFGGLVWAVLGRTKAEGVSPL